MISCWIMVGANVYMALYCMAYMYGFAWNEPKTYKPMQWAIKVCFFVGNAIAWLSVLGG